MASSGYTVITFVANEQPTTAKWNLIGSNDASFNNGNGFEDDIIINRHIADLAVKGENIDFADIVKYFSNIQGQITYANVANFSNYYDMTGASYSITPTRNVMFIAYIQARYGNGSGNRGLRITQNGTVISREISQNLNASGHTLSGLTLGTIASGVATTLKAQMASAAANEIIYSAEFSVLVLPR